MAEPNGPLSRADAAVQPGAALPETAEVVIIGAGPVGLLLAAELTRRGLAPLLLERRSSVGGGIRAIGVHAPVLAALEPSGITERLLATAMHVSRGEARSRAGLLGTLRFDRLDRRFPFVATLPQADTEAAIGGPGARRGTVVQRVEPDGGRMRVRTADGDVRARIVVVAGGAAGRELAYREGAVRVRAYADRYLMADVAVEAAPHPVAVVHLDRPSALERGSGSFASCSRRRPAACLPTPTR